MFCEHEVRYMFHRPGGTSLRVGQSKFHKNYSITVLRDSVNVRYTYDIPEYNGIEEPHGMFSKTEIWKWEKEDQNFTPFNE